MSGSEVMERGEGGVGGGYNKSLLVAGSKAKHGLKRVKVVFERSYVPWVHEEIKMANRRQSESFLLMFRAKVVLPLINKVYQNFNRLFFILLGT